MASAKIVIIYPRPQDEATFEQAYKDLHIPMAKERLEGINRFVVSKVNGSPQGEARTYRIEEAHFSNQEALQASLDSAGGKQVLEHAQTISTGGKPLVLICDEETFLLW